MNTAAPQAQGLEGSRFVRRQLYGFAAGGSRKRPSVFASIQRLARIVPIKSANISNDGGSWVAFGSRLLPSHRAAALRSGSPPDAGHATPRCSLENEAPRTYPGLKAWLFCQAISWPTK